MTGPDCAVVRNLINNHLLLVTKIFDHLSDRRTNASFLSLAEPDCMIMFNLSYSIIMVMLGCDWGLRMVINITCFKIPGSGFIFAASKYPSMTNKEIIQYTSVLFTQAPIRVCLDGTNIDSRTILVTTRYVLLWLGWGMIDGCAW